VKEDSVISKFEIFIKSLLSFEVTVKNLFK